MADHADHHHAAPAKPNATTFMGIALFLGMVTVVVALVGGIRDSSGILSAGLATGVIAVVLAVLAALGAKRSGRTTRGFAVSVLLGLTGIAMYLLVTNV
jgi:Co/Zn/Cd efflux system component